MTPLAPLAACSSSGSSGDAGNDRERPDADSVAVTVDELTTGVLGENPDGVATSAALFASAQAVIVCDGGDEDIADNVLIEACEMATAHGIPVLVFTGDNKAAVDAEIDRLGAEHVLSPGDAWPDGIGEGRRGDLVGVALAGPNTGRVTRTIADAAGMRTLYVPTADPRATNDSLDAVTAADDAGEPVVGLGDSFGDNNAFISRLSLAATVTTRLAGGGGVLFPGRRMVALYGHPGDPALGALGEHSPETAVDKVKELAASYEPLSHVPVVPTFEIITTVAASEPGPAGAYSSRVMTSEVEPLVEAVTAIGGYAILDLQPGRERMLDQAKSYEKLLLNPQVGLALDPEWKLGPDDLPMQDIGTVSAGEINEVVDWLDTLVAKHRLPQKLLMVHQFQTRMISEREAMSTGTDHVNVAVHCDGHGDSGMKFETWNVVRKDLSPEVALGWKNFYDEDTPMFTPKQTMAVSPTPSIVTYQ